MIAHFNGWFVGGVIEPENEAIKLTGYSQALIASFSCICVNMFLIISGYFGVRLKIDSIIKICLTVFFIHISLLLVIVVKKHEFLPLGDFLSEFLVISRSGYFVQCYLMLLFLSPVLNSFVEKFGNRILPWVIILVVLEFWFGLITKVDTFGFNNGYSVIHFVVMYFVGRCVFLYKEKMISLKRRYWFYAYIGISFLIFIMYIKGVNWSFSYSSPFVIFSTICSFIPFIYKEYHNSIINWFAKSSLAVYIIHVTPPIITLLMAIDNYLLANYSYIIYLIGCILVIFATFILCVLFDKLISLIISPILTKARPLFSRYNIYCKHSI